MTVAPILIAGQWREPHGSTKTFHAFNPGTGSVLTERYPISSEADVEEAVHAGREAARELRAMSPVARLEALAAFLEGSASRIEARRDEVVQQAHLETALPKEPRLASGELPRMTDQLRQAARAVRQRSFCRPIIDTKNQIRSMFESLGGPVVVMGPNNFPFAFNAAGGGDFAAAVAAGNPVIAKAHPAHPGTTRLLAEAILEALKASDLPRACFQLFYHLPPDVGLGLVAHPGVAATAFTGSRAGGLALKQAADRAGNPIYLEMSSINPVFVLPGALETRGEAIAQELFASCSMGAGQFCTNPGVSIVPAGQLGERFTQQLSQLFESGPLGTLLSERGPGNVAAGVAALESHGAKIIARGEQLEGVGFSSPPVLLSVAGNDFLHSPALHEEVFGTVHLVVLAKDLQQMCAIAESLEGNLTGCIMSDVGGSDDEAYAQLAPALTERVGRLLNDKMPTGVAVSPAMNHGGPYPASGHPGFTSVGIPASIRRFTALRCYDGVRPARLPPELGDVNPTGELWRQIDGEWTQANVAPASVD